MVIHESDNLGGMQHENYSFYALMITKRIKKLTTVPVCYQLTIVLCFDVGDWLYRAADYSMHL